MKYTSVAYNTTSISNAVNTPLNVSHRYNLHISFAICTYVLSRRGRSNKSERFQRYERRKAQKPAKLTTYSSE